jgi:hypothetical protein
MFHVAVTELCTVQHVLLYYIRMVLCSGMFRAATALHFQLESLFMLAVLCRFTLWHRSLGDADSLSRKMTTDWLHCQSGPLCADNYLHRKGWCSDTWQSAVLVSTGTSANMTAVGCSYLESSTAKQRKSAFWVTATSVQIHSDSAYCQGHTESNWNDLKTG